MLEHNMFDEFLADLFDDLTGIIDFLEVPGNDTEANRKLLLRDEAAKVTYCHHIQIRPELRDGVVSSTCAWLYCMHVEDDPIVRAKITDSIDALNYCRIINDDPAMAALITSDRDRCVYCSEVADREEVWSKITDSRWALYYCININNRPEVRKYISEWDDMERYASTYPNDISVMAWGSSGIQQSCMPDDDVGGIPYEDEY